VTRRCSGCGATRPLRDFPLEAKGGREHCRQCADVERLRRVPDHLAQVLGGLVEIYGSEAALAARLGYCVRAVGSWRRGTTTPRTDAAGAILALVAQQVTP